ncbi:MAG: hypothetical protein IPJ81_06860 [Chitinophagaceae bacterium]|nr:hypothetical protein [Chitinophagaceae bacterium]
MDALEELQKENKKLKEENSRLEKINKKYEENGIAKLYYSLSRKAWEMGDLMNDTDLKTIEMDDPKSKKFDRLKIIWQDAASLATAIKALGDAAGVTGDEVKDVAKKGSFLDKVIA